MRFDPLDAFVDQAIAHAVRFVYEFVVTSLCVGFVRRHSKINNAQLASKRESFLSVAGTLL